MRCTFVENHHDISIENTLDAHRFFRRQKALVTIDGRLECHPLLRDFPQVTQTPDLKAARIGKNWSVPSHEFVQTIVFCDDLQPRTQPQMKGITQYNFCADLDQFCRAHAFYGAVSAHGHKNRRFNNAVSEREPAAPRGSIVEK